MTQKMPDKNQDNYNKLSSFADCVALQRIASVHLIIAMCAPTFSSLAQLTCIECIAKPTHQQCLTRSNEKWHKERPHSHNILSIAVSVSTAKTLNFMQIDSQVQSTRKNAPSKYFTNCNKQKKCTTAMATAAALSK